MTEVYDQKVIRPLFKQLVRDFGGYDAAAAVMQISNKGTLSKMISGELRINPEHWGKLEDAAESYPISTAIAGRITRDGALGNIRRLSEGTLRELGDIPGAILHLAVTNDASRILKEGPELMAYLSQLMDAVSKEEEGA
ncbi:hypothetical protein FGG78_20700 [Thioclava sp. BHET1]|nr:hypothetical protein FGG78_20700 [Thioclava sp. BHET1]